MTLQATPPLSLTEVQTEFVAPLGTPLSAFLRGGAFVPDTPTNAGVPTVLPIALLDLLGSSVDPAGDLFDLFAQLASSGRSGYVDGSFGSITPDIYRTFFVDTCRYRDNFPSSNFEWRIDTGGAVNQDFFSRITIVGPLWDVELFTVSATTFDPDDGGLAVWNWEFQHDEFDANTNYAVTLFD